MAADEVPFQLLELPDPCLLEVLQCCADDLRSLFSVARAHSRLHQAAVLAARAHNSLAVEINQQQQVDDLMLYLSTKQERQLVSIKAPRHAPTFSLRQLPQNLQLVSLKLFGLTIQLQPRDGFPSVLPALQHLTYLDLDCDTQAEPAQQGLELQPLGTLTRLSELHVHLRPAVGLQLTDVDSGMLSGLQHLTRLKLSSHLKICPDILTGMSLLQHLECLRCHVLGAAAGFTQLLSGLHCLTQLTALRWKTPDRDFQAPYPVAAAFSALTASSKMRQLDISGCTLPEGAWQHVFPAGRQLPHLQQLNISDVTKPPVSAFSPRGRATAPAGAYLVRCCPGLVSLDMQRLQCSSELLAPLQGLSNLHTLCLYDFNLEDGMSGLCQG